MPVRSATNGPRLSLWVPGEFIEGITFGMTLTAQSGHEFTVPRIPDVDPGLSVALHDRREVTIGFTTATGKRARKKIKYK